MKQDILGLRKKGYGWCKAFSAAISGPAPGDSNGETLPEV